MNEQVSTRQEHKEKAGTGHLSPGQRAGTLLLGPRYLLGHPEADIGAELEHFTHLFWSGWDQGNLLYGGRLLQFFEPLYKLIIS